MEASSGQILEWFSEWLSGEDLVPFGSQDKEGIIYELELFAAIRGAKDLLRNTRHHDVVLFCDNEAALACLIGGRADGEVAAALLSKLIELEESHDICFWFEWVASQCNPADAPLCATSQVQPELDSAHSSLDAAVPVRGVWRSRLVQRLSPGRSGILRYSSMDAFAPQ